MRTHKHHACQLFLWPLLKQAIQFSSGTGPFPTARDAPRKIREAEPFVRTGIGCQPPESKKAHCKSRSTSLSSGQQARCFRDAEQEERFGDGRRIKMGFRQQLNKSTNWMWKGQASYQETYCKGQVKYTKVSLGGMVAHMTSSTTVTWNLHPPFQFNQEAWTTCKHRWAFPVFLFTLRSLPRFDQPISSTIKRCFHQEPWLIIKETGVLWEQGSQEIHLSFLLGKLKLGKDLKPNAEVRFPGQATASLHLSQFT